MNKEKIVQVIFTLLNLLSVILIFTIIDHSVHSLNDSWSVPDYYFKHKIPYGFLLSVFGLVLAIRIQNIWLKALIVGGFTAIALQTNYFLQHYPLDFVLIFALLHFLMLYPFLVLMFYINGKFNNSNNPTV